jgi:hypothetical protein
MVLAHGDGLEGPDEGAFNLGDDHYYTKGVDKAGNWIAIHEWHKTPEGRWCVGYVPFDVDTEWRTKGPHWEVVSLEPLTLSPTLLCTACTSHGFIREGRWVAA